MNADHTRINGTVCRLLEYVQWLSE